MSETQQIDKTQEGTRPSSFTLSAHSGGRPKKAKDYREYMRQYYLKNKDKALEYQRQYYRQHKKKSRPAGTRTSGGSAAVRETFTTRDIMQSPTEKAYKILDQIVRGERYFVR